MEEFKTNQAGEVIPNKEEFDLSPYLYELNMEAVSDAIKNTTFEDYSFTEDFKEILCDRDPTYPLEMFLDDVCSHGCVSGVVGALVYYSDTRALYDAHFEDFDQFECDLVDERGQLLHLDSPRYNSLVWYAFEEFCDFVSSNLDYEATISSLLTYDPSQLDRLVRVDIGSCALMDAIREAVAEHLEENCDIEKDVFALYDKYGIPTPKAGEEIAGRTNDTSQESDPSDPSDPSDKSDESDESDSPKSPQLKDFPSAPQVGAEPAEQKKRSWFRQLTNSITARLKLSDDGYSIDLNKLLAEAIKEVYGGEVELSRNLFQIQNNALQQALDKTMSEPEFGRLNSEFVEEFRYNTAVFSAFKAHAETEAMVALLTKEDGSLRSFWEFKKLAKKLSPKWNEQWLRTEYNTAVRSARSAVNYRNALRTKDLYPNLEYIASTAKDKRPDHLEYVGTVLPIEHPWWDTHLPPSEWNCKCSVRPSDKPTTEVPEDSGTSPAFQNNAGKTAEFVKLREHPYLKGKGTPTCPECRRQGLTGDPQLKDDQSQLCPMHRLAKEVQQKIRKEADEALLSWYDKFSGGVRIEVEIGDSLVTITKSGVRRALGKLDVNSKGILSEALPVLHQSRLITSSKVDQERHNIEAKQRRGVDGYRYYSININGETWYFDTELRKNGEEHFYAIHKYPPKENPK